MFWGFSFDFYNYFIALAYSVNNTCIERQSEKIGQYCCLALRFAWEKALLHPGILGVGTSWSLVYSIKACCSTFEGQTLVNEVVTTNNSLSPVMKRSSKIMLVQVKNYLWIVIGFSKITDCYHKKAIITVKKSHSFDYLLATFSRSKVSHPDDFLFRYH